MKKTILEPFQFRARNETYDLIKKGYKRIVFVLPGGGGKTVMMSEFSYDYINETSRDVASFVHRQELLDHYRTELLEGYGMFSHSIDADTKHIPQGIRAFACMVETFDRRSEDEQFLKNFSNVGLLLIDEGHLNNFNKIFKYFPQDCIIIAFTATPISAVKKDPLINRYDEIIVGATIKELIELNETKPNRGIVTCQGFDYSLGEIDISKLRKKKEDYDEQQMSDIFGADEQIDNTIDAYEKICVPRGLKTLIFNCDIRHSIKMHERLLQRGQVSQHIHTGKVPKDVDSKYNNYGSKKHREYILGKGQTKGWIETYDKGACALNNVGIATIGTDIKSIEAIIINRSVYSFTYFLQMVYRGDRACVFPNGRIKTHFYLIDMGNNILLPDGITMNHGRFENPIDWKFVFHNPNLPRTGGVGAIKRCPECGAINPISASICKALIDDWISGEEIECSYMFPSMATPPQEDISIREVVRIDDILKTSISVSDNIELFSRLGNRPAKVFYETIKQVCTLYGKNVTNRYIEDEEFELVVKNCVVYAKDFFRLTNIPHYKNYKKTIRQECYKDLQDLGFLIRIENIEDTNQVEEIEVLSESLKYNI